MNAEDIKSTLTALKEHLLMHLATKRREKFGDCVAYQIIYVYESPAFSEYLASWLNTSDLPDSYQFPANVPSI